jgi:predicted dehydrogenase
MRGDGIVAAMASPAPLPRVAIVGLGIGRAHAKGLGEAPAAATICALCDVDRERLRRVGDEFGVAARYSDLSRLLRDEAPDAVIVATPNHLHEPMALAALAAGCHVLVEKPLGHTLASARTIAAAAAKARRLVMLDLSLRFGAAARTMKAYLDTGRCGRLYHASTYWCRTRGIPSWSSWFADRRRAGGGPVIDLGVHRIDLGLWFLGDPAVESVAAVTHGDLGRLLARESRKRTRAARFDVEEFGGGLLRLAGGRALVFEVSWAENSGRREVMLTRVLGLRGGAVHRNAGHSYDFSPELYADRRGTLVTLEPRPYAREAQVPAREFARAITASGRRGRGRDAATARRGHGLPDARRGLELQRVLTAIYRSARERREVAMAEIEA